MRKCTFINSRRKIGLQFHTFFQPFPRFNKRGSLFLSSGFRGERSKWAVYKNIDWFPCPVGT